MNKFILKAGLFFFILTAIYLLIFIAKPTENKSPEYTRIFSDKYHSLILGTSMAAQDISPIIINSTLNNLYQTPIFNFSFSIGVSPFGELYLEKIKTKTLTNIHKNSLYILAIDPYSLGLFGDEEDYENKKRENGSIIEIVSDTKYTFPKIKYLVADYLINKNFLDLSSKSNDGYGRFITTLELPKDTMKVKSRIQNHILPYYRDDVVPTYRKSKERMDVLAKTVDFLSKNGDVFLVRLPIEHEIYELTDSIWQTFDEELSLFANQQNIKYISFFEKESKYKTTDGVHLYKSEGDRLTRDLCDSIIAYKSFKE